MRRLALFACGMVAACLASVYWLPMPCIPVAAAVTLACVAIFFVKLGAARYLRPAALGLAVGLWWCIVFNAFFFAPLSPYCGRKVTFSAQTLRCDATSYGTAVEAYADLGGRKVRTVFYTEDTPELAPGEIFRGVAVFSRTVDDDETYGVSRDVFLSANLRTVTGRQLPDRLPLVCRAERLAQQVKEKIRALYPEDAVGIMTALVTGDRSGLDYARRNQMSLAGIYHAVSLSGMHVSILMGMVWLLTGKRRRLAAVLGIPALIAFCMLTGAQPSTVRASVMQAVLLLAPLARREYDPLTALSAAMLLILTENPWSVAHWGLQLSACATLGILVLYPRLQPFLERKRNGGSVFCKPIYAVLSVAAVTLCASAFSLPLTAAYFGTVSLLAPLVNVLSLWAITVLFFGGLISVLLPAPLCAAIGGCLAWLCRWVLLVVRFAADQPWCAVSRDAPPLLLWAVFAYFLWLAALLIRPKWWEPLAVTALTLAVAVGVFAPELAPETFTVLDVGQGQCLILRSKGQVCMMDCGGKADASGEAAARYLIAHGARNVDTLIVSHYDKDHTNGISQLMERLPVQTILLPRQNGGEEEAPLLRAAEKNGAAVRTVSETTVLPLAVVYPPVSSAGENEGSLAVMFQSGAGRILATGDLPGREEAELVRRQKELKADVLVAGHHGAKTSTGDALLQAVSPSRVLCSAGKDNPYGHPAAETVRRIAAHGGTTYCTAQCGTIELRW